MSHISQFSINNRTGQQERGIDQVRRAISEVLGIPEGAIKRFIPALLLKMSLTVTDRGDFFFSEPNIVVTGTFIHPLDGAAVEQTDLILFENGTNDNPDKREWLEARLASGRQLFVFDPRGIGGVQVRSFNRDRHPHDGEFKLASDAMMLGISTMGLRVFDILRAYDYLRTRADVDQIGLYGIGKARFTVTLLVRWRMDLHRSNLKISSTRIAI